MANDFGWQQKDFGLIKEFQGRVSNCMKSFTEESTSRKTDVHREDFQSLSTSSQIWNLFNSQVHDEIAKRFQELNDPEENDFVELRDYLLTMLLLPASLSWDTCIYKCSQIYLEKLRPIVANDQSFLQRNDKKEKEPLFFLTVRGNPIPSSQISNRLTKVVKLLDRSIAGNATGR